MEILFTTEETGPYHVVLALQTPRNPSDAEWGTYADELRRVTQLHPDDLTRVLTLVISDGGVPNTYWRSVFQNDIFQGKPVKIAVLTNALANPVKRSIARVFSWMNPGYRIFEPTDLTSALEHLQIPDSLDAIWSALCGMQARLPPIETLAGIARALGREVPAAFPLRNHG